MNAGEELETLIDMYEASVSRDICIWSNDKYLLQKPHIDISRKHWAACCSSRTPSTDRWDTEEANYEGTEYVYNTPSW